MWSPWILGLFFPNTGYVRRNWYPWFPWRVHLHPSLLADCMPFFESYCLGSFRMICRSFPSHRFSFSFPSQSAGRHTQVAFSNFYLRGGSIFIIPGIYIPPESKRNSKTYSIYVYVVFGNEQLCLAFLSVYTLYMSVCAHENGVRGSWKRSRHRWGGHMRSCDCVSPSQVHGHCAIIHHSSVDFINLQSDHDCCGW